MKLRTAHVAGAPSSAASQPLLEETEYHLADTQQRLRHEAFQGKEMYNKNSQRVCGDWDSSNAGGQNKRPDSDGEEGALSELYTSEAGSELGFTGGFLSSAICSAVFREDRRKTPEDHSLTVGEDSQVSKDATVQSGNRHSTASTVKKIGFNATGHSSPPPQCNQETPDSKVSRWLAHTLPGPPPHKSDFTNRDSRSPDGSSASRHVAISLFPPKSPSTGKREYTPPHSSFIRTAGPISPLNNGRDVYGNYIPSNTRDYLIAHTRPSPTTYRPIKEEENSPDGDQSLYVGSLRGGHWDSFKPFQNAAGSEVFNQRTNPHSPPIALHGDIGPHDISAVTYPGRLDHRALQCTRSPFSVACSRPSSPAVNRAKSSPSTPDTRRYGGQDWNLNLEAPELIRRGETTGSRDCFDMAIFNYKTAQKDEKRRQRESYEPLPSHPPLPSQRSAYPEGHDDPFVDTTGDRSVSLIRGDFYGACRKIEHDRQPRGEACREPRQDLMHAQETRERDQSSVILEDGTAETIRPPRVKEPSDKDIQTPDRSAAPWRNAPRCGPLPVPAQCPKKVKDGIATPRHPAIGPEAVSVTSATVSKHQNPFRTVLSKAGKLSRSILTAPFDTKLKSSSRRHLPMGKTKSANPRMSADSTGWPSPRAVLSKKRGPKNKSEKGDQPTKIHDSLQPEPATQHWLNRLLPSTSTTTLPTPSRPSNTTNHPLSPPLFPVPSTKPNAPKPPYRALTAGAVAPSSTRTSSLPQHQRHASLASATNEALLLADRTFCLETRCSPDLLRSSFSSDSTGDMAQLRRRQLREMKKEGVGKKVALGRLLG